VSEAPASRLLQALTRLFGVRFVKFATVGASGTVVNMAVLYLMQEYLLAFIAAPDMRLNASLAVAILIATINNFSWNRLWTWADRGALFGAQPLLQFFKYACACWLGITIQFLLTKWLAGHLHYLLANLIGIVLASVFNFLLNDIWTFEGIRLRRKSANAPR
jgi:putative flippase GtrA